MRLIDAMPTIEAITAEEYTKIINDMVHEFKDYEPVKHGRWIVEPDAKVMNCNDCNWVFEYYGGLEEEWNYCPHCGAKMDPPEEPEP